MLKELPKDRLASTDEKGKRAYLFPADVRGKYHTRRMVFQWSLMALFIFLPWIQINGHPAILLDIGHRRFAIMGLTFWAHDAPMLMLVFGSVFLGFSLMTAIWGRVWCGWACPETVFVERLYRQIERWIEGNAVKRKRLSDGSWTTEKLFKKGLKWGVFAFISWQISHAFLAYFIGTEALAQMMISSPSEHPTAFGSMLFITFVLLFSFGWFREQFCIVMCPYGRFQSVLMDEDSTTVAYDQKRGEPRRGLTITKESDEPEGDCINCYRCVQVCPTGIDIRRGSQMECIACTACIDVCDEVMDSVKKPKGLIRYASYHELNPEQKPARNPWFRPRVLLLTVATSVVATGLGYILLTRPPVKATVFSGKGTPFEVVNPEAENPLLTNRYFIVASNYKFNAADLMIEAPEGVDVISQHNPIPLDGGEEKNQGFFLRFPKSLLKQGSARILMTLKSKANDGSWEHVGTQEVPLIGPY